MRIISSFHDYYDGLQDPKDSLIYLRKEEQFDDASPVTKEIVNLLKQEYSRLQIPIVNKPSWVGASNIQRYNIYFCGQFIPLWSYDGTQWWSSALDMHLSIINMPKEEIKKHPIGFQRLHVLLLNLETNFAKEKLKNRHCKWADELQWCSTSLKEQEQAYQHNHKISDQSFRLLDAPVFGLQYTSFYFSNRWTSCLLTKNPCLNKLNLQSRLPPWYAYQELDMFLGNNLAKQEEKGNTGSDEVIRDSKGFDEWSFKNNPPGQKEARRKANKAKKKEIV